MSERPVGTKCRRIDKLAIEALSAPALACIAQVEQIYASLMQSASAGGASSPDRAPSLGGKLVYAGELDEAGRILAIADNISGAATLSASDDADRLRLAQHSGAIDFLVNSLDEALRILKNEIRKREAVAVAVSIAPAAILAEMLERGVLPDLLPLHTPPDSEVAAFLAQGARRIAGPRLWPNSKFLIWQIPAEYAQRPAAFEEFLLGYLPEDDLTARRWLRLSPRYLGPQFRRLRSLRCDEETAARLIGILGSPLQS